MRLKWLESENPQRLAISAIGALLSASSSRARASRRARTTSLTVWPLALYTRFTVRTETPTACATAAAPIAWSSTCRSM